MFDINIWKKKDFTVSSGALSSDEVIKVSKEFTPGVPGVNLLPESVNQGYKLVALRNKFIFAIGIIILSLTLLLIISKVFSFDRPSGLDSVKSQIESATKQRANLLDYQIFYKSVEDKRQTMSTLMAHDIDFGNLISLVEDAAASSGVSIGSINVVTNDSKSTAIGGCPSPDPFGSTSTVGCISFSGVTSDRVGIGRFVSALNSIKGFTNAYVPSSTVGGQSGAVSSVSQVSGTVSFTDIYYTGKYTDLAVPLSDLFSGTKPPAAAGESPTAAPSVAASITPSQGATP